MKNFLLYLWQLPQNIAGFILSIGAESISSSYAPNNRIFLRTVFFDSAVSLGDYIIVDKKLFHDRYFPEILKHESGHSGQSVRLGWFYLLVIGVPSLCRNIWARIKKKDEMWYYSGFPENWADKLGGVERNITSDILGQ